MKSVEKLDKGMAVFDASTWKNFLAKQFLYATSKLIKTEEDN